MTTAIWRYGYLVMYCYKIKRGKTESNEKAGKPDESFNSKVLICRTSNTYNFCRRLYITFSALGCQVKGNKDIRQIEYSYINIFDEMANNE